jgi:hypothetical protein
MDSELQKVVQEGKDLIKRVHNQNKPKRKILLNRAEMGLKTFEVTMKQLILDT